jgi:probable HAF family extracellular repeat protein
MAAATGSMEKITQTDQAGFSRKKKSGFQPESSLGRSTRSDFAAKIQYTMKRILPIVCFYVFSAFPVSAGSFRAITDLGTLGGTESFANAINEKGQVVGESRIAGDQETHIFLYDRGNLVDLSVLYNIGSGPYLPTANDINNRGQIVGNISNGHAALLSKGVTTDLGTFGGVFSSALGINNSGQIVGYYSSPDGLNHAFLYSDGNMTGLGPFGAEAISVATAINDSGMIVGEASDSFTVPSHAFLYSNGVMSDISPFGNSESYAEGINNRGQVVGEFLTADGAAFHAFLYSNGVFTDLGSAGSPESVASAINDRGQVVGTTFVPFEDVCFDSDTGEPFPCTNYKPHAFLYENGVMTDLNTLLRPGSGWELTWALDINNKGQIVGYGLFDGKSHAFLIRNLKLMKTSRK